MFARIDFSKLTLMDALDLATLIEVEAFRRYDQFAQQLGQRSDTDAASVFAAMARNEKKHGSQLSARRRALFGDAPALVKLDDIFDVEAPEVGSARRTMSQLKAFELALAAEQKAFAFYDEALPFVGDPEVVALFRELRDEETDHVRMVSERIAALPPEAGVEFEYDQDDFEE